MSLGELGWEADDNWYEPDDDIDEPEDKQVVTKCPNCGATIVIIVKGD